MTTKTANVIENQKLSLLITFEVEGDRVYFTKEFYDTGWLHMWTEDRLVDRLKGIGCVFDSGRRQWRIGTAEVDKVEATIRDLAHEAEWKAESVMHAIAEKAKLGAILRGLVPSSVGPTGWKDPNSSSEGACDDAGDCAFDAEPALQRTEDRVNSTPRSWSYYRGVTPDGQPIVKEKYVCGDDLCRISYHAPEPVARQWALTYAAEHGITVARARERLATNIALEDDFEWYGNDLYWAVVIEHEVNRS